MTNRIEIEYLEGEIERMQLRLEEMRRRASPTIAFYEYDFKSIAKEAIELVYKKHVRLSPPDGWDFMVTLLEVLKERQK